MMTIDSIEFVKTVRKIAAENPDKIYEPVLLDADDATKGTRCVYVEKGSDGEFVGSCLIGCALVELGMPPEDLDFPEGMDVSMVSEHLQLRLSREAVRWADHVQSWQDQLETWNVAIEKADRTRPLPAEYRK